MLLALAIYAVGALCMTRIAAHPSGPSPSPPGSLP